MKTDIKVGDIVKVRDKYGKNNVSALVIKNALTYVNVIFSDGEFGWRNPEKIKPTGKHIEVQGILESIK